MGKLFGTDGVRGIANKELLPQTAFRLGQASALVLTKYYSDKKTFLIGRDTRLSGTMLECAFAAGVCSLGFHVTLAGVLPTPAIAYLVRTSPEDILAGVVISASHNPMTYNGIKFFDPQGYKLPDAVEEEIEEIFYSDQTMPLVEGADLGYVTYRLEGGVAYGDYLRETLGVDLTGLKIVVDCANGSASYIAPDVFRKLGAQVVVIHAEPNGININEKCGSTHLADLIAHVQTEKADLGLAFDGDADRLLAVAENGEVIDGDQIIAICAKDLAAKGALNHQQVVVTLMSNMGLRLALQEIGIEVLETKVGDRYVLEKLMETGAVLGGEQSGHIIFADTNTTGDGLATALHILQVIQQSGAPLSEISHRAMVRLPQYLENVPVKNKLWQQNPSVSAKVASAQARLADTGRVVVRASGTEPLLRVMAEGKIQEELEDIVTSLATCIRQELN